MIKTTLRPMLFNILNTIFLLLAFFQSPYVAAFHPTNETDKLALLAFKDRIHDDPLGIMDSWNESVHFCEWKGVSCSRRHEGKVVRLNLVGQKLVGSLPPHIGNLSFMRRINLSQNYYKGEIPQEVGRLFRLRSLDLRYNIFQGRIPSNLSSCSKLVDIVFNYNELTGEIPIELGNLQNNLRRLAIFGNHLTGGIPQWLGNASLLEQLSLGQNNFRGSIPHGLGRLSNLRLLQLGQNDLSGYVPPSIFNLSSLSMLSFAENQLHGRLPLDIGFTLPNLWMFSVGYNSFYGVLPPSLINATKLGFLEMGFNNFGGVVPSNLGSLRNLQYLGLGFNQFEAAEGEGLGFVTSLTNCSNLQVLQLNKNHFKGELPASIANLSSTLQTLLIGMNPISGQLPRHIGNLVSLTILDISFMKVTGEIPSSMRKLENLSQLYLESTRISGSVPSFLGNLTQLQLLVLSENSLSGPIPPSLGNCSQLQSLYLDSNYLTGNIPKQIFSLSQALALDLTDNHLTGQFPLEVGNLSSLVALTVSNNRLSGRIPNTLSNCLMLEELRMDGNLFQGDIPPSFSSLKSLKFLDLSRNNLSGQIPKYLQNISFLQYLNLSFNDFVGELPTGGVFGNASVVSVTGNPGLCGGIHQLGFPPCEIQRTRGNGKFHRSKVLIAASVSCSVLLILLVLLLVIFFYVRKSHRRSAASVDVQALEGIPKISYAELSNATDGFSSSHLIGQGSFGSVYRGILGRDGKAVAIKVLNLLQKGASKSFIAECEALKNIRHRNLIKIVTVCSSIDFKGTDFKALVYEFMQNGSLEEWLHPNDEDRAGGRCLSFTQRLNIAIDVACALEYLHDHCTPPIVHGDLKPSNVLLDENMVAHVGDFGLARFLSSSQTQSSSIGIKGTIGYVAPEYGMNRKASKPGDVYAFGILLLEMITGKRPTDAIFKDSFTIHQFTKSALSERVIDVLQPSLLQEVQDAENLRAKNRHGAISIRETLVAVTRIGVLCSMETPNERMEMKQAAAELRAIRDKFIGNRG